MSADTSTRATPSPPRPRVAVVTGGSRGIGAASSIELARRGWAVCVGYRTARDAARQVVQACQDAGVPAVEVRADVGSPTDIADLFAAADDLGELGALVNNAGILAPAARLDEIGHERIERLLAVNVVGSFLCAGEAVRRMSTRRGGRGGAIVNLSSVAAKLGGPHVYVDYAASKGAVDTMTTGLAREVADEGIRVNAVRPGIIDTDMHASGGMPDRVALAAPEIPMKRGGRASEVANAIAWLCSDEASYVTGAFLDVSGGR